MNEYETQAQEFLNATNTSFKSEFYEFGTHFEEDTQKRNIFNITLSNSNGEYTFKFGSSINDSCKIVPVIETQPEHEVYCGIKIGEGKNVQYLSVKFNATLNELHKERLHPDKMDDMQREWNRKADEIKKKVGSKYVQVNTPPFRRVLPNALNRTRIKLYEEKTHSNDQLDDIKHPTAYDVLACLTKYDPDTFESFCGEYGYDEDSRKAERIYEAVKDEYENVAMLWDEQQIEQLAEIQ